MKSASIATMYSSPTKQASEGTAHYISITGTFGVILTHIVQFSPDNNSSSQLTSGLVLRGTLF
jgi:hypothetical protein